MDLDQLKEGWQKGKRKIAQDVHFKKKEMEAIIKKQANTTTHGLSRIFLMGIVIQSLTIILLILSGIKYSHVNDLFIVICVCILPISLALYYSLNRYAALRESNFENMSISDSLINKIEFYKFSYNKWLLSYASSFVFFIWSINMMVGDFTSLNSLNPRLLLVYLACFLIIYFSYRFAHVKYLREYEVCLDDLGGDHVTDFKALNKKFKLFMIILIAVLTIIMLTGIIIALI